MSFLSVFRSVVFSVISVFAATVLAMGGYLTQLEFELFSVIIYTYGSMALATGAMTILIIPTCLIIDRNRQGAWTSMIIFELVVMSFLWVLWVTTAALSSQALAGESGCPTYGYLDTLDLTMCQLGTTIEALSYLASILILAYVFILLVFTFIATSRGNGVWTGSVKNTNFFAPGVVQPQPAPAQFPPNLNFGLQQPPFVQTPMPIQPMYPNYQPGMPMQQPMQQMPGTPLQQYTPQGVPMIVPQYTGTPV